MRKNQSNTDRLFLEFLEIAKELQSNVEVIKVLKSRVYQIGKANVLIRAASESKNHYFFGINYITIEEIANLQNPFIAFICGSIKNSVIIPATLIFDNLDKISHDRNGEYKINIDNDFNLALKGKKNRLDCSDYFNNWKNLESPINQSLQIEKPEESLHSIIQGRLLEVGNYRGFHTFCPDKTKKFNKKPLSDISTLDNCPKLQFSDYDLLRKIDVLWFKEIGSNLIPEKAFEVELSTGTWSGVGRMSTLSDYSNVSFYVVSNDLKKYSKVIATFPVFEQRFKHLTPELIGELYKMEKNIGELKSNMGL